ncbi:nucleoporin Ndc1 [Drosophila virilis]|uniref:Nucleoporin Ndc1 n=1 Tax=Drosophila virilis TaxID=7244 RepID=B4LK25_DROVI|nr:nucleoporin Ndc1 [Drosophila virilis]EDW60614.2 uncharacterized protein Dvir_GJ20755 [Drosophila virilis]
MSCFPKLRISMPFGLPYQLNMPNSMIGRLLLNRYLFATWLCYLTEYQLLAIFLLYQRFDIAHPIECLSELFDWIVFSYYTMARMQLLGVHVAIYGLLLCRIHERLPACHSSRQVRMRQELPIKLCLLTVLISLGYCSCWLYLKYMDELNVDVDVSYTGHFLLMNGAFCGLAYFLSEHSKFNSEVWPLPIVRMNHATTEWLSWQHFEFRSTLPRIMLYTIIFAAIYWPNMNGDREASWQLFRLSNCLTMLITLKLYAIKRVFGMVMHCELPLTVQQKQDQRLPLVMALSLDCQLYGFQMQAARDFYMLVSSSSGEQCELFQLQGNLRRLPKNWQALRDVLLGRITLFTLQLKNCLEIPKPQCQQAVKSAYPGLRPLAAKPKPSRYWSRRCGDRQPPCQPLYKSLLISPMRLLCHLRNKLQSCQLKEKLTCYCQCRLPFQARRPIEPRQLEHELCLGRPLVWLIPGLVAICVRSLEEDKHGSLHMDLEAIFQSLVDLDRQIGLVRELLLRQQQEPCLTLDMISQSTTRALNSMTFNFYSYLDYLVKDLELLRVLRKRAYT